MIDVVLPKNLYTIIFTFFFSVLDFRFFVFTPVELNDAFSYHSSRVYISSLRVDPGVIPFLTLCTVLTERAAFRIVLCIAIISL